MNPEMMQKIMHMMAGAGLEKFTSSLKKIHELVTALGQMTGSTPGGAGQARPTPPAVAAMMANRGGSTAAPSSPPDAGNGPPPNMQMLAQLMAARQPQA